MSSKQGRTLERAAIKTSHYSLAIEGILETIASQMGIALDNLISNGVTTPVISWKKDEEELKLSVAMVCLYKSTAIRFFFDMVTRWLMPGKTVGAELYFGSDFQFRESKQKYIAAEVLIHSDSLEELELLKKNLEAMSPELKMGLESSFHAKRVSEIRGFVSDEKSANIQRKLAKLVEVRPEVFGLEIFGEMQHFLALAKGEFKALRTADHLARIALVFFHFRRELKSLLQRSREKRHVLFKVMRVKIESLSHAERALAIWAGISHLYESELFDEKHLMRALAQLLPGIEMIPGSIFIDSNPEDPIKILYFEIRKGDGTNFSFSEIAKLKSRLTGSIKGSIEKLTKPLFMPRNEEEVMRNIVTLRGQLRYVGDPPQVILSFEGQTDRDLLFTLVMARVILGRSQATKKLFEKVAHPLQIQLEKAKKVGALRKKYPKEVTISRVRVDASSFLRADRSVDLYRARQAVISQLQSIFGDVRDYNGGMIAKELENFYKLRELSGRISHEEEWLLENYFYSIYPVEMRSVIDAAHLARLYRMLSEFHNKLESSPISWKSASDEKAAYFAISVTVPDVAKRLLSLLEHFKALPSLISCEVHSSDQVLKGYLYFQENSEKRELFIRSIEEILRV